MTQPWTLTDEQRQRIAANPCQPTRFIDPTTQQEYVILQAEVYDRLDVDWKEYKVEDSYGAIDEAFAENWDYSGMELYDNYEENLQKLRGDAK